MLERQTGRAGVVAGDDQRGDLHHLALTAGGGPDPLLRLAQVVGGSGGVAGSGGRHGEQGELDGALGHGARIRRRADAGLISG